MKVSFSRNQAEGLARVGDSLVAASIIGLALKITGHAENTGMADVFGLIIVIILVLSACLHLRGEGK